MNTAVLLHQAQTLHAQLRLAEAMLVYRRILEVDPDHAGALRLLGMILVNGPDEAEAEAVLMRHLALRPRDGASLYGLGRLRARQGDDRAAAALFRAAAAAMPDLAPAHNELGVALHRLGETNEALACLDRATAIDATYGAAQANRGALLSELGRFEEAVEAEIQGLKALPPQPVEARAAALKTLTRSARKAGRLADALEAARTELAAHPLDADLLEQVAECLEGLGRADDALALRNAHARRIGLKRGGRGGAGPTVLVLGGVGAGHVPVRYLLDLEVFATLSIGMLTPDQADAPLGEVALEALQGADLVFSTLGDADRDGGQFAAAEALCAQIGKPVINPPAGIAKTGRDRAAELLAGIPDLIVPVVTRASPRDLTALSITAPMLVRPAGDHGGENLVLLRDEADKQVLFKEPVADRLLLTSFHDYRSPDGLWRKYRLIFVDRQVYPYHLAIGSDWLVHYWRAEMARASWKMAEEERFLDDWRGVFGARGAAAVEAVARRLDLDYGGIDCALTEDGQVLLFEANACILLHLDEPISAFPYKHRHVPPIRDAFTRLVKARAGLTAEGFYRSGEG